MIGAGLLTVALAGARLGVALEGGADLPSAHDGTAAGLGPGLAIPMRIGVGRGAELRATFAGYSLTGHDRVEWTEENVLWYSDSHKASFAVGELTVGPEIGLLPSGRVNPYVGVALGIRAVAGWHSFSGGTASLREGGDTSARDTLQLVPAAGALFGVRVGPSDGVAVELEAGYTVSFLPDVPLGKVPTALGASRTAFALDRARMGFGVSFPL